MRIIPWMMKNFQIHLKLKIWFVLIICAFYNQRASSIRFKASPCPGKFNYESTNSDDHWYGDITFPVNATIEGSTIRIELDRPSQLLVTTAGPITSKENQVYFITHDNVVLEKGSTYKLIFMVKFHKDYEIPMLETIHFNGQRICPPDPATLALGGGNDFSSSRPDIKATAPTDVISDIDKKPKNPSKTTSQPTFNNNNNNNNNGDNVQYYTENPIINRITTSRIPNSNNFGGGTNTGNQGTGAFNNGGNFGGGTNTGNQGTGTFNNGGNFGGGGSTGNQGNGGYNPNNSNNFGGGSNNNGFNPNNNQQNSGFNPANQGNNNGFNSGNSGTFGGGSNGNTNQGSGGSNSGNSNTFGTNGNINQGTNGFNNFGDNQGNPSANGFNNGGQGNINPNQGNSGIYGFNNGGQGNGNPNQGTNGYNGGGQGNANSNQGGDAFNQGGNVNNGFTARPIGNEATVSSGVACGSVSIANPLITLAQNSEYGQWPWHVALFMKEEANPSKWSYICGGSLVSKNRVITAAHCVSLSGNRIVNPNSLTAHMGKYNINNEESTSQKRAISSFKVNPEYNKANFHNDIAILNLKDDVEFTTHVRPICLWEASDGIQDVVGKNGMVVGWGYNEYQQLNTELKQATMPIVSTEKCARSDPQFFSEYVSDNAFCAGSLNGTGPCKGDSGGGLVLKRNNSWYLRGIVSVSAAPKNGSVCNNHHYIVFTDTAKYTDFIKRNL